MEIADSPVRTRAPRPLRSRGRGSTHYRGRTPGAALLPIALAMIAVALVSPAADGQIRLRVVADPPGPDEDNLNGEVVTITNQRTVPLDLSGWYLCDAVAHCYTFPDGTRVGPGAAIRVHTGSGRDTLVDLYMGRSRPVWDDWADMTTLRDSEGVRQARCLWDRGRGINCRSTAR